MINQFDQTFLKATKKPDDKLNILYYPFDGLFEHFFCKMDFIGYVFSNKNNLRHEWKSDSWPDNLNFFSNFGQIDNRIDLCIVNNRESQVSNARILAKALQVPLILIDHEPPQEGARSGLIKYINSNLPEDVYFIATENFIANSWMYNDNNILRYGFKCEDVPEKQNDMILIGDYAEGDLGFIEEIKKMYPGIRTAGYNSNTEPYHSIDNLILLLKDSKISISAVSPTRPPIMQLLSAANGSLVITNKTQWTENIFTHGENALLFDSVESLKRVVDEGMNEDRRKELTNNARKMIEEKYSFEDNQKEWKNLLIEISNKVYIK